MITARRIASYSKLVSLVNPRARAHDRSVRKHSNVIRIIIYNKFNSNKMPKIRRIQRQTPNSTRTRRSTAIRPPIERQPHKIPKGNQIVQLNRIKKKKKNELQYVKTCLYLYVYKLMALDDEIFFSDQ